MNNLRNRRPTHASSADSEALRKIMKEFLNEYLNPLFELLNYNLFSLGDAIKVPMLPVPVVLLYRIDQVFFKVDCSVDKVAWTQNTERHTLL